MESNNTIIETSINDLDVRFANVVKQPELLSRVAAIAEYQGIDIQVHHYDDGSLEETSSFIERFRQAVEQVTEYEDIDYIPIMGEKLAKLEVNVAGTDAAEDLVEFKKILILLLKLSQNPVSNLPSPSLDDIVKELRK